MFSIVNDTRESSFRRALSTKAMLLWVEGLLKEDTIDVPGAKLLQSFQKIIGQGDGPIRCRQAVVLLSRFR